MRGGRDFTELLRLHPICHQHVWGWMRLIEVIANAFRQYRRREWTEGLTMLDTAVQNVFHLGAPGVSQDAASAKRARSELHSSLKPSDYLAIRYPHGCLPRELFIA